ncbi:MAG: TonB-dependent receptor, plug [Candidatus Solibacter sp.]|nr:TonB-dependent receptor, plug [Candidatus Solibacter sp.]
MKITRYCLALAVLLASLPTALLAQFETASVLGTLKDGTGAVIVNGKLTLENTKTGVISTTQSNDSGNFDFVAVQIGTYRLKAETPGFKTGLSPEFTVAVSARQRVDLTLEVGDVTQTVAVKDTVAMLETDSSDRGQVINNATVVNLPLNGRNYSDLALLAPGVRKSFLGMDPNNSNFREGSFNVNGQRSAFNNFQVDGVDNNAYNTSNQGYSNQAIQLSPDAVAEFKVQTDNFSAEYGRAGGAIINVSLKSGTNQFHGAAWEFLRNTDLNAVGYFKPANGKPVFQQNQFGGVFGGPVIKNKTFFFVDFEALRRKTATLAYLTVPTTAQRNGIFDRPIKNPYTGEIYSDGVVPKAVISAFAAKVFSQMPAPTTSGTSNNYQALPSVPSVENKGDARVDHYFNSKATAYFRYSHREFNQTDNPQIPLPLGSDSSNGFVNIINKQIAGGVTYTVSPTSLLEFRMGYTKSLGGKWPIQLGMPGMLEAYGIPGLPTDPEVSGGLNTQAIGGYLNLGRRSSTPQFQNPTVLNPKVNFSRMFSQHSLKLGYEWQHIDTEVLDFSPQYGQDSYNGQFSAPTGASSNNIYNVADFLFGARSSYQLTNVFVAQYRQRMNFFYVQDDWKVSKKLTLNLGVRYEYATPQWEDGNHLANFVPGSPAKMITATSGSIANRALVNPDRNNWAPRLGLAYSLTPKTVIRSGYGISYIHFNRAGGENLLAYNPPSVITININNPDPLTSPTCAAGVANSTCFRPTALGYTSSILDPTRIDYTSTSLRYTPPNTRTGYVQSWHFTVQQQLAKDLLLEVAYVGNHGVKLMTLGDVNQARPQAPNENTSLNARRPYLGFADVEISYQGGYDIYHALQAKVEKRFSGGFYFLNSFTWSKLIDNSSGHLEANNGDNSRVNFLDPGYNKGVGSYNQPFNNTTTLVYALPYGKGRKFGSNGNPFLTAIIGGWQATVINTMTSGMPVNINYGPASRYSVSGYPTYRPNLIGDPMAPIAQRNIDNYFNKANVVIPVDPLNPNPFGNAGRNTVRSYAIYQTDLGLHKEFPLGSEVRKLQFRSEFFNVMNKTNFQAPNSTSSSSAFGTIRSAFAALVIQMALKLVF